ncbi:chemotaxis protein [Hoeflea marina]|uniref:chemotaxis protein n=1 Tax=Hoeflea marina TaxID=274592 RepID=UPI0011B4BE25|nr:chemotaxis protein [Hoeflea marina]
MASDAQGPHPVDQVPGQPGHVEEEAGHASPDAAQAPTDAAHAPADAAHAPADAAHAPADAAQAPTDAAHAPADAGHAPAEAGHAPAHPAQPPALAGVKAPADRPAAAGGPETGKPEDLDPYKLVRSLQFVQDAVVQGDHSAMDMQRFLLGVIDARLRQADQTVFDDPRNVDAALIYAMSGGNPATLDMLVIRDRFGNFDNEITTVLRAYLNGRAAATKTSLLDLVKIYQETTIGPYLALVAANVLAGLNEESSLGLFDWARLTAPGTLVEEAALRRSLSVAQHMGKVDRAIEYAALYARRFIRSPYAGQYADLLVDLLVDNYDRVGDARLDEVLTVMDRPRKREVYLRISRKAVIRGMLPLASFAAAKAEALMDPADSGPAAMADLYSSMAQVPTGEVVDAMAALDAVPEQQLSPRDKALRAAARQIAYDVLSKPDPASLTQATSPRIGPEAETGAGAVPAEEPVADAGGQSPLAAGAGEAPPSDGDVAADKEFQGYVSQHQKSLDEIDKLLKQGTGAAGT